MKMKNGEGEKKLLWRDNEIAIKRREIESGKTHWVTETNDN